MVRIISFSEQTLLCHSSSTVQQQLRIDQFDSKAEYRSDYDNQMNLVSYRKSG